MKCSNLTKIMSAALVIVMLLSLAACDKDSESSKDSSTAISTANKPIDPLGKYDPPIKLTTIRIMLTKELSKGATMDNNIWYQTYESELGIKLENMWVVAADQYTQKFNVAVASNDLPDVFDVNNENKQILSQNGMLADLTFAMDKYVSPATKEMLNKDGGLALATSKYNGKFIAIPETNSFSDYLGLLFIRKDWLDKLKLAEPKTMDDVIKIAEAFTKQDPDENGKDDTYGLALKKDSPEFSIAFGSISGFFNSYHAYPNAWIKDSAGKLIYGSIQPEMKQALLKLSQMYKDGILDKEFAVKDYSKLKQDVAQGKVGIGYGLMYNPLDPLQLNKDTDPKADWKGYSLASADGKPALAVANTPVRNWHVANVNCKNPEAVVKMTNLFVAKLFGDKAEPYKYSSAEDGTPIFGLSINRIWPAEKNLEAYRSVAGALTSKDASKLKPDEKAYYDSIVKYQAGDNKGWGNAGVFGIGGTQSIIDRLLKNKTYIHNEFDGALTTTMQEKNPSLLKLQTDMVTKIILGTSGIDEFDKFVTQWKSLGGDDITKEVNAWYSAKR